MRNNNNSKIYCDYAINKIVIKNERLIMKQFISLLLGMLVLPVFVNASQLKMAAIFGNNMLLQRDMAAPVWGKATPGATVKVNIAGQTKIAIAAENGKWMLKLDPLKTGGPVTMTVESGNEKLIFTNVLVGDVWFCSGQSNMEWSVFKCGNGREETRMANYPEIRLFKVGRNAERVEPAEDCKGEWKICSPGSVKNFSAVGYYFGRMLHKELKIPVGLIGSYWGGSFIQCWMPRSALESDPDFKPILERNDCDKISYKEKIQIYHERYSKWEKDYKEYWRKRGALIRAKKKWNPKTLPEPKRPKMPYGPDNPMTCSMLYNRMLLPVVPYGIKGVIWYQGESNNWRAYQYRKLQPAMIKSWRQAWGEGDFPFLIVQLANFRKPVTNPNTSQCWPELREAQFMATKVPNTGIVTAIDIGEEKTIHPKNKQEVGRRLALTAMGTTYGKTLVYSGPVYDKMKVEGNKIRIYFTHIHGGLVAKGGQLKHFAIAGKDRKFFWANAEIDGNTVLVWSDKVKEPVAVRYAWADNPSSANLYNKEGFPAFPFRTDGWPGCTMNRK